MLFYQFFSILIKLFTISREQEINYTIISSSIKVDYCDIKEGVIFFHIDSKINPKPYCNMKFNILLSDPTYSSAECIIYDDINYRINSSLSSYIPNQRIIKIDKQSIKLNIYRAHINLLDFHNNSININCSGLYINKKIFINYFIIILIFFIFI